MEERRRRVLHMLVEAFVATNRPVPSRDLAEPLGVSSATIRNDLAVLEDLGYLHQPHTSAGRVPTRDAFRAYALGFLPPRPLDAAWRERLVTALERSEGEGRLRMAARIAASLSGYATATVVAPREAPVDAVFLTALADGRVLVVVILRGGVARELTVDAGFRPERGTLERVEDVLRNAHLPLNAVPALLNRLEDTGSPGVSRLARALRERWGEIAPNVVFAEGAAHALVEPESQDVAFLRGLLEMLERPPVPEHAAPGEVALAVDDPKGLSAITVAFRSGVGRGSVVIVGPTRMRYPTVISVAKAVSDALSDPAI